MMDYRFYEPSSYEHPLFYITLVFFYILNKIGEKILGDKFYKGIHFIPLILFYIIYFTYKNFSISGIFVGFLFWFGGLVLSIKI